MWANFHCHTRYCDGKHTVEEITDEAFRLGLQAIGFSSHAPFMPKLPWCMSKDHFHTYLEDIRTAGKLHEGLEVYAGLEVDYIPEVIGPTDFRNLLDFTIGSVHLIGGTPGIAMEIDGPHERFKTELTRIYQGNFQEAARVYFDSTRRMINNSRPDIVGHMDKIKIQNLQGQYFSENDLWWRDEIEQTLKEISRQDCILEVNTRGIYQKKYPTTYPSPWVLEHAHKLGIRVTISSDAHVKTDLVREFTTAAHILLQAGYREIHILSAGKWISQRFNEQGLTG